jgi:hypothetical protein
VTRPKITPKKTTPDVKRSLNPPAVKPTVTPTAKTRRSAPAKASPSVKPPERKTPNKPTVSTPKTEIAKKPMKKQPAAKKQTVEPKVPATESDHASPTVSEVLDETVAKLIDLELDERGRNATEPEIAGIASSNRSSTNPSPTVEAVDEQCYQHGLQSKLDFNTLNLKKVKTREGISPTPMATDIPDNQSDGMKSKLDFNSLNLKKAVTRVGGVSVDIAKDDLQPRASRAQDQIAPSTSAGSSEIVVEEHSVQSLLSRFNKPITPPPCDELTTTDPPSQPPSLIIQPTPSQTNPTIASLKHPSQTSVASSSVTSLASDITNELTNDTDTDKDTIKSEIDGIEQKNKSVTFNENVEKIEEIQVPIENGEKEKKKEKKKSKKKKDKDQSDEAKK